MGGESWPTERTELAAREDGNKPRGSLRRARGSSFDVAVKEEPAEEQKGGEGHRNRQMSTAEASWKDRSRAALH